ncbi:MAG: alpha/beta fold hydrolase [Acidimicrobiia bacterium]
MTEHRIDRPDGRTLAFATWGPTDGQPFMRVPGTPGSRHAVRADTSPWDERGLRVLLTERPGFGASSRHEGAGFLDHADDLAAVLDELGLDRVPICGASGAAPFLLALAARHPERVSAVSVIGGAAPLSEGDVDQLLESNAAAHRLRADGRLDELRNLAEQFREEILAEGAGSLRDGTPAADHGMLDDSGYERAITRQLVEALREGVDGLMDEGRSFHDGWDDLILSDVRCSVTWWHSVDDRNCPLSATQRLVAELPDCDLRVLTNDGHLFGYAKEGEILDELLARHRVASGQ